VARRGPCRPAGTLTYTWADKGGRPPAPRDCRYSWAYIFGAVCPARGTGAALVLPYADKEAMTLHLAEISKAVAPSAHAVVIIDGAEWHKPGGRLKLPDNISTLTLPPYSPELNPQENTWQCLRQNYLSNRVSETYAAIVNACCAAWNALIQQPQQITSIVLRNWAQQVIA
jgi:transposase